MQPEPQPVGSGVGCSEPQRRSEPVRGAQREPETERVPGPFTQRQLIGGA